MPLVRAICELSAVAAVADTEHAILNKLSEIGVCDFETVAECHVRQEKMIRRLQSAGYGEAMRDLRRCDAAGCVGSCKEACHFGTRWRRVEGILSAHELLHTHAGPIHDVCIVHPRWERPLGKLAESNIPAAVQWHYRRLNQLYAPGLIGVGSYEVSLNIELDGETYWAGEVHTVVAGAEKHELQEALSIERHYREVRPNNKLLAITPIENLGRRLAYSMKRFVEQRCAYRTKSTGRQARRHLPLPAKHWAEHDAWLLSLPLGARTVAYGCRRHGARFLRAD